MVNKAEPPPDPPPPAMFSRRDVLSPATEGKTAFVLSVEAINPDHSYLAINGRKWFYQNEYHIVDVNLTLTNPNYTVSPTDLIEILYFHEPTVALSYRDVFIPTDGQTVFQLTASPTAPDKSILEINGRKWFYGVEYMIAGTVLTLLNVSYTVQHTDLMEIIYY